MDLFVTVSSPSPMMNAYFRMPWNISREIFVMFNILWSSSRAIIDIQNDCRQFVEAFLTNLPHTMYL